MWVVCVGPHGSQSCSHVEVDGWTPPWKDAQSPLRQEAIQGEGRMQSVISQSARRMINPWSAKFPLSNRGSICFYSIRILFSNLMLRLLDTGLKEGSMLTAPANWKWIIVIVMCWLFVVTGIPVEDAGIVPWAGVHGPLPARLGHHENGHQQVSLLPITPGGFWSVVIRLIKALLISKGYCSQPAQ